MNQYGVVAVLAAEKIIAVGLDPREAWEYATKKIIKSETSQEKGCPKATFLGLCEEGKIINTEKGIYQKGSSINKQHALDAVEFLKKNDSSDLSAKELWAKIPNEGKSHQSQMDVVLALVGEGYINYQASDFSSWIVSIGKSQATSEKYATAITGSISQWAIENNITKDRLDDLTSYTKFQIIADKICKLDKFRERNTKGKGMYSSALNAFKNYLKSNFDDQLEEDITDIVNNKTLEKTQTSALIQSRLGQGIFRKKLVSYWKGCSVTGYKQINVLLASHIKPWKESTNTERLDVYNGFLLLPNLDKTFDLGYITFDEKGLIQISNELEEYERLGIKETMRIKLGEKHQSYMESHREKIFYP